MEFLALVLVTGLIVRGYSDTIQCYNCDNCGELDDSLLQSCPLDSVTSSPVDTPNTPISDTSSIAARTMETTNTLPPTGTMNTLEPTTPETTTREPTGDTTTLQPTTPLVTTTTLETTTPDEAASYHCYSIEIGEGAGQQTKKGCVTVPENKTPCEALKDLYDVSETNCRTCSENKCNSSGVLKYSLLVFVTVIVMDLFY